MDAPKGKANFMTRRARFLPTVALLFYGLGTALAAEPYRATTNHRFDDVGKWQKVFDEPTREIWQKPKELVAALGLQPGMAVADLGAGTGYFVKRLAEAVGKDGVVYAVEVEPNLVAHLRERAERERTRNVVPVLASLDNPRLPRRGLDLVLIVDTFHHLDDRLAYLRRLRASLTDRGRVAIVDWKEGELEQGPPPDHKLPRAQVVKEMTAAGYTLLREPTFLSYQYFLIFVPGTSSTSLGLSPGTARASD